MSFLNLKRHVHTAVTKESYRIFIFYCKSGITFNFKTLCIATLTSIPQQLHWSIHKHCGIHFSWSFFFFILHLKTVHGIMNMHNTNASLLCCARGFSFCSHSMSLHTLSLLSCKWLSSKRHHESANLSAFHYVDKQGNFSSHMSRHVCQEVTAITSTKCWRHCLRQTCLA